MIQHQEKDPVQLVLEANRRRLGFEMREVMKPAADKAQAAMEKEFFERLSTGEVMRLENDTAETRRFLLDGLLKEMRNGTDIQSSIEP